MDLCLPENWNKNAAAVFRDDLGPQAGVVRAAPPKPRPATATTSTATTSTAFVCGLRDWRLRQMRPAPVLRPSRAPAWVLAELAR